MSKKEISLELISEEIRETYDYIIIDKKYKCPCGEGYVLFSKEKPNGNGFGYQATFIDYICNCDNCKKQYDFRQGNAYTKL